MRCRASCHSKYRAAVEAGKVSAEVEKVVGHVGGRERDSFVDILGYEHHICDLSDGRIQRLVHMMQLL